MTTRQDILDEAKRIVSSDRNQSYGEPSENFRRIATLWTVFLEKKLAPGQVIEPADVGWMEICTKIARRVEGPKHDHPLDTIGYAACASEVETYPAEADDLVFKRHMPEVVELDEEQAHVMFDRVARKSMGMSGEEFLRRWDAGEWYGVDLDSVDGLVDVWMVLPFVRLAYGDSS